jgi:hypothetical protein
VRYAHRVERKNDLLVIFALSPQAYVQLVEVPLVQLGRLLNPNAVYVEYGFELFNVVQPGKDYLRAVGEGNEQVALVRLIPAARIIVGRLEK